MDEKAVEEEEEARQLNDSGMSLKDVSQLPILPARKKRKYSFGNALKEPHVRMRRTFPVVCSDVGRWHDLL